MIDMNRADKAVAAGSIAMLGEKAWTICSKLKGINCKMENKLDALMGSIPLPVPEKNSKVEPAGAALDQLGCAIEEIARQAARMEESLSRIDRL